MKFLQASQHLNICFEVYDFSWKWLVRKTSYADHSGAGEITQLQTSPKLLPLGRDILLSLSDKYEDESGFKLNKEGLLAPYCSLCKSIAKLSLASW